MPRSLFVAPAAASLCLWLGCASKARPRAVVPLETAAVGAVEVYGPGLIATDDTGETVTFELTASASVVVVRVWPGWRLEQLYPLRTRDTTYFQTGQHTVHVPAPVVWAPAPSPGPGAPGALPASAELQLESCVWQAVRQQQSPPQRVAGDTTRRAQAPPRGPIDYAAIEDRCRRAVTQPGAASGAGAGSAAGSAPDSYLVLVASDFTQDARHLGMRLVAVDITASSLSSVLQVLPRFLAGAQARTWAGYVGRIGKRRG